MKVVVIGGSGHIGTYLIPQLVDAGHEVINVSRSERQPYSPHPAWSAVTSVTIDRVAAESTGVFGQRIAGLLPDVVIDLICFNQPSAEQLVNALKGKIQHLIHCGTIWVHGHSTIVPTTEDRPRQPFGEYGVNKAAVEHYLLQQAKESRFPVTLLHPGHIVGPGWNPVNPAGNFNLEIFKKLASGAELSLPNFGMETVHHVHAEDVASAFMRALENPSKSIGESFHVVSPTALTLRGYAEEVAGWFGQTARLQYLPFTDWAKSVSPEDAAATWDHIAHSPNCSIEKARQSLGFMPRYSSLAAIKEAVDWLISSGKLP